MSLVIFTFTELKYILGGLIFYKIEEGKNQRRDHAKHQFSLLSSKAVKYLSITSNILCAVEGRFFSCNLPGIKPPGAKLPLTIRHTNIIECDTGIGKSLIVLL